MKKGLKKLFVSSFYTRLLFVKNVKNDERKLEICKISFVTLLSILLLY